MFLIYILQIFVAIEEPVELAKQNTISELRRGERRDFTKFIYNTSRHPELWNSNAYRNELGTVEWIVDLNNK